MQKPPGIATSLTWRDQYYIGIVVQKLAVNYDPDYDPEIVLLSKSAKPWPLEFYEAVFRLDPGRLQLTADNDIDLEGKVHIVRRVEDKIEKLTDEQTRYMERITVITGDQTGQFNIIIHKPS